MQKHYSKILFIFFLSLNSLIAKAQWVTIPDTNFVNWLNGNGYASCMNGNLMDTTCNTIVNALVVQCGGSNIYNLEGIQYFDSLQSLECQDNFLTTLPLLPANLTVLTCLNNQLTSIADLPNNLIHLYCMYNYLTSLPAIPFSLQTLNCGSNNLTTLPTLNGSLIDLICNDNQLTGLPSLPPSLEYIQCQNNQIISLPTIISNLQILRCNNNFLSTLPSLPNSLSELTCNDNNLTALPSPLPSSLNYLYCFNNQITSLSALPISLNIFDCSYNQLTSLPVLPASLQNIDCSANQIVLIPNIPPSLSILRCTSNDLSSIPDLPNNMIQVYFDNNPNLTCFPKYQNISELYWGNTAIMCLPNAGYIGTATPPINNLPLCLSISGCDFHWNIFGRIYQDANANCIRDTNEFLFRNITVQLDSGGNTLQTFISNTEGYYSFQTGLGNYQIKIDTTGLPFDVMCPASGYYLSSLTALDSLDADLDFGLQCKTGYLDLIAKSISPSHPLRPSSQRTLYLNAGDATLFYGVTCSVGISGSVKAILNGPVSYLSPATGALTPTAINGDTISWSVNDFSLINPTGDFNIIIQVDSIATVTDTVCVQLNITPVASDNIPSNNSISNCFPIVNSLDPNAKEIYPGSFVDTTAHNFTFTIYFQNTGNAVAENIYILDTLDNDLNVNTFQFLSSSHDVITQLLPGNILRFNFPHINLPDSVSNEPASHGYVQFKISRNNNMYPDMIILNHAYIFFDFNPPVTTNDAYAVLNFDCNDLLSISFPDTAICENEIFTANNNTNFPFPINYEWMIDSTIASTTSSVLVTGLSTGVHNLTLNVSAGYCTVSQVQQIIVNSLPLQPAINIFGDTLSTNSGFAYQWFLNSNSIIGAVQNNYLISQSGWYSVLITDLNGCSALSDSVFVSPVGIQELTELQFSIYPMLITKGYFYVSCSKQQNKQGKLEIFDVTGKSIYKTNLPMWTTLQQINIPELSSGIYNCIVTTGEVRSSKKLVVINE